MGPCGPTLNAPKEQAQTVSVVVVTHLQADGSRWVEKLDLSNAVGKYRRGLVFLVGQVAAIQVDPHQLPLALTQRVFALRVV